MASLLFSSPPSRPGLDFESCSVICDAVKILAHILGLLRSFFYNVNHLVYPTDFDVGEGLYKSEARAGIWAWISIML